MCGTHFFRLSFVVVSGGVFLQEKAPLALFVLSKREEPNLLVKTIAAEFQEAKIGTVFISQPDEVTHSCPVL